MSRPTDLSEYNDTPWAEEDIEDIGQGRIERALADAEIVNSVNRFFVRYQHEGLGMVIRFKKNSMIIERVWTDEITKPTSFEPSQHALERASERGFLEDEPVSLAESGVCMPDPREDGLIILNRLHENTVLIPVNESGVIKTIYSRQGPTGGLYIDGNEMGSVAERHYFVE